MRETNKRHKSRYNVMEREREGRRSRREGEGVGKRGGGRDRE